MGVDAGSVSSSVRIKLADLNKDIIDCKTAFDNLGTELATNAAKYSNISGKQYAAALKNISKEVKNVESATKAGALSEASSVQRLIELRRQEIRVLQDRAVKEGSASNETVVAIKRSEKALSDLIAKQKLLSGESIKASKSISLIQSAAGLLASAGLAKALTSAVSVSKDFQQAMANVASVTGATGAEFDKLVLKAQELGEKTRFSASEAADALYYLGSAGYSAQQSMDALDGVLMLAGATQSDLAFTSETMTAAIAQYGLQASDAARVSNVYAAAIAGSQATIGKLADSMKMVGPIAGSFGMSIEEVTSSLMVLYNKGFGGEQAGTALRSIFIDLADSGSAVVQSLKEYGVSAEQVDPKVNSLAKIIDVLNTKGIDLTSTFGKVSAAEIVALAAEGGNALVNLQAEITGTNAATEMYEKQNDTLAGSIDEMESAAEGAQILLGDEFEPILRALAGAATNLLLGFSKLPGPIKTVIGVLLGVTAAAAASIPVLGMFGVSLAAALGPILIVAAALAGVGIAATLIAQEVDKANDPLKYFNKELAEMGARASQTTTKLKEYEKASSDILAQAKKNNEQDKLTKEQADKLIEMYPDLAGEVDLYTASLAEVAVKLKEVQRLETERALAPLISSYMKQHSAITAISNDIADYKKNYSDLMDAQKKKVGPSWNAEDVAKQTTAMINAFKKGMDEYSDKLSAAQRKGGLALDELNKVARASGMIFDSSTLSLRRMTDAEAQAAAASKSSDVVVGERTKNLVPLETALARINELMKRGLIDEKTALTESIKLRAAEIERLKAVYLEKGKLSKADELLLRSLQEKNAADQDSLDKAKDQAKNNEKLATTTEDYRAKLDALNGKITDTIELERQKALAAIKASGASAEAMAEAEAAVNEYYDALAESKSFDEFMAKTKQIAGTISQVFNAVMDAVKDQISSSTDKLVDELERAYEEMTEASEEAYERMKEQDEAYYEAQNELLDEQYELKRERIENDGLTKMESLQAQLDAAMAANDSETASDLQKQIDLINIETEYETKKKALEDAALADQTAKEEAYLAEKEAREKEYENKKAQLEYKAALSTWRISVAEAVTGAAVAVINGLATKPFVPAGIAAGIVAGVLGAAQVASAISGKPSAPQLATGGIILPQSGGVLTTQAENGYPEIDFNAGPSGRPFMKSFAREMVNEMGGAGGGGGGSMLIQVNLDGRLVAESTAQYINNGRVKVEVRA